MADSLAIAKRLMYDLLGRRWIDPPIRAVETHHTRQRRIRVQGRPIMAVDSVTVDGEEITDFDVYNGALIELPKEMALRESLWLASTGWTWTGWGPTKDLISRTQEREVIVDYTYGTGTPDYVQTAIEVFADELDKALAGDESCKLNSRVTSVASRGIDMTLLDAETFLENGLTGVPEIDLAIMAFNPTKAKRRARVYSPDYRPGRRHQREGS